MANIALEDGTQGHMLHNNTVMPRADITPLPPIPVPSRITTVQAPGAQDMTEKDQDRDRRGDHGRKEGRDRDRENMERRKAMKPKRKSEQHSWVAPLPDVSFSTSCELLSGDHALTVLFKKGPATSLVIAIAW